MSGTKYSPAAERSPWFEVGRAFIILATMWFCTIALILIMSSGQPPDIQNLQGDALLDGIELSLLAQGLGVIAAVALALRLRLPMSWIGVGRLIGTVPFYLLFMVFWVPIAMILYPWCLSLLGIALDPQPHLAYFTSGRRGLSFYITMLTICVLGPLVEEIIYRGFLQTGLTRVWGPWVGLLVASLLFGLAHGLEFTLPLAMMGAFFGFLRNRTGGLAAPILAHILHNTVTVIVTIRAPEYFEFVYKQ